MSLPVISFDLIRAGLLWIDDWWDWELAGVAKLDGRRIYFSCIEEPERAERVFAVYDLPADVWAVEDECHADFVRFVGDHYDYQHEKKGELRPKEEWSEFYDKWGIGKRLIFDPSWQIAIADSRVTNRAKRVTKQGNGVTKVGRSEI